MLIQPNPNLVNKVLVTLLLALSNLISGQVQAFSLGITGYSGKEGNTCSQCHSGADFNSSLRIIGDTNVSPNETVTYNLLLNISAPMGISNAYAGFNLAATSGVLSAVDSETKLMNDELVQSSPKQADKSTVPSSVQWQIQWTAGAQTGNQTLFACAEPVDRNFGSTNDANTAACAELAITVGTLNAGPVLDFEIPNQSFKVGNIVNLNAATNFSDPGGDSLAFSATGLPQSLSISSQGVVSGTLIASDVSTSVYVVTVTASDDTDSVSDSFDMQVLQADTKLKKTTLGDFDGDNLADKAIWRPSNGTWFVRNTIDNSLTKVFFGALTSDVPVPGDFDGDNLMDLAFWRSTNGFWYIKQSNQNDNLRKELFGTQATDIPLAGDYDGDGISDLVIRRPSTGHWFVRRSSDGKLEKSFFGSLPDDVPVPGDFDGDGQYDLAFWRPGDGTWYIKQSSTGTLRKERFGTLSDDVPAPGDFDGDGITDLAIWRKSTGVWFIRNSSDNSLFQKFYGSEKTDIPVPLDYDGDGRTDLAFRRPTQGRFYVFESSTGKSVSTFFGSQATDVAVFAAIRTRMVTKTDDNNGGDPTKLTDTEYFNQFVSTNVIQANCIECHTTTGLASITRLIFKPSTEVDYQAANLQTIIDFINDVPDGKDLLLSKPRGVSHGGGVRFSADSDEFNFLSQLVNRLTQSNGGTPPTGPSGDFFAGISLLDNEATLRKAAILLAGRVPITAEIAQSQGDDAVLKTSIRAMLQGDNFDKFIMETVNDRLLTDKFRTGVNALNLFFEELYPDIRKRINSVEPESESAYIEYMRTNEALAQEPLRLVANVVKNERPYTEILTADYIMVNPWSSDSFGSDTSFNDSNDPTEWREGEIKKYFRMDENYNPLETTYPHAGLLNSPMFLARYPSTATNRNRARARWTYKFFLGVDIESLAPRTTDPDALADTNNPTMNNANCTVCHQVMDPVAGTFQNWGDEGYYRSSQGGYDSLPYTYKDSDLYQFKDTWYRDMRTPGIDGKIADNDEASLQWLAQQIVKDSRFSEGTVKFWFSNVFGHDPLNAPEDSTDADFATRLTAFESEDAFIKKLASGFSSGTSTRGAFNLKDLLVEMVLSKRFRAITASDLSTSRTEELAEIGQGQILTPAQLNRKFESVTGFIWDMYGEDRRFLTDRYNIFYGGIDSDGVTVRVREINTLMSGVVAVMANETACPLTLRDFIKPKNQRLLFPLVEAADTPNTNEGVSAIKNNIQYLHQRVLGENLAINDAEIERTYQLFKQTHQSRIDNNKPTGFWSENEACVLKEDYWNNPNRIDHDPNQTLHSWMVVMVYLLGDYRFIYE